MSEPVRRRRPWVRWLIPVATLILLALFARRVDWKQSWDAVVHADPGLLLLATVINLVSLAAKGVRWAVFLDAIGISGVLEAVRATFVAAALNNVVVANGGDAARVAAIARRSNTSSASVLATLAVDRLCDLFSYAILFAAVAFALPLPPQLARWRTPGLIALGLIAAIVGVLWRHGAKNDAVQADVSAGAPANLVGRARDYWRRVVSTFGSVLTRKRLALAAALSVIAWVGQWGTFHYAAHAAAFPVSPSDTLLALIVVNASFLVRLTPGNVGVFQLLYTLAASSTGLDKDSAVAVAFLIQLIQYIPVTVIGLLLAPSMAGGRRSTSRLFDPERGLRVGGEQEGGA